MANYQSLKAAINAVIKANGNKEITGTVLNEVLLAMVNSLGAGYQFAGVATPSTNPGTPDQKVFYIASQAGTYTNFNGAVVSDGIAIFEWNDTWTTETLDLSMAGQVQSDWTETDTTKKSYIKHKPNIPPSANVDPVPTEDSPNAVSSGGTYDMIVNTAVTLFGDIQDATNVNAIESVDGKIYNDYQAGDIFFIVDNNVRKYRVALVAGTADAEHPVTISPVNFYYALNSADAINLSLTLKTVSTELQSLSSQQKAQARTNIAAVSYDQQSLSADQKVQAQNNMMGKAYAPAQFSGLGKKVLSKNMQPVGGVQKNVMTQAFFQDGQGNDLENTVFVIQYDYTLGENITIPAGCTLQFDGGSISDGTITGNMTKILYSGTIFRNITIAGTWNIPTISSSMFADITEQGKLKNLFALQNSNIYNEIIIEKNSADYIVANDDIIVGSNTKVVLDGNIRIATNSNPSYAVVAIYGSNVQLSGSGLIKGDKDTHDFETAALALGTKVLSTSAANTPSNKKLYINGNPVNGDLLPSASLAGNVYWVRNANTEGTDIYDYYMVNSSGNAWERVNSQEWGHGVYIGANSSDITINGIEVLNCIGDGIYQRTTCHNVLISNVHIHHCRRQGITIQGVEGIIIENFNIHDISRVEPSAAIDIEPNKGEEAIVNGVIIRNGVMTDNNYGVVNSNSLSGTEDRVYKNITVSNVVINNCQWYGIIFEYVESVFISDCTITGGIYGIVNRSDMTIRGCHIYTPAVTLYKPAAIYNDPDYRLNVKDCVLTGEYIFGTLNNLYVQGCQLNPSNTLFVNNAVASKPSCVIKDSIFSCTVLVLMYAQVSECVMDSAVIYLGNKTKLSGCTIESTATSTDVAFIRTTDNNAKVELMSNRITVPDGIFRYIIMLNANTKSVVYGNDITGHNTTGRYIGPADGNYILDFPNYPAFGGTAARPVFDNQKANDDTIIGLPYFDQTLGKPTWYTGDTSNGKSGWVDATGADVPNPQS